MIPLICFFFYFPLIRKIMQPKFLLKNKKLLCYIAVNFYNLYQLIYAPDGIYEMK